MNHFIPTANAAVYPRPPDAFARTEELVELVVRARGKVGRVPVFSHTGLPLPGKARIVPKV